MRGLTAGEYDYLSEENVAALCNCLPDGTPGEETAHPRIAERLVSQGRAEWVFCDNGLEHFCVTAVGREALRIERFRRK